MPAQEVVDVPFSRCCAWWERGVRSRLAVDRDPFEVMSGWLPIDPATSVMVQRPGSGQAVCCDVLGRDVRIDTLPVGRVVVGSHQPTPTDLIFIATPPRTKSLDCLLERVLVHRGGSRLNNGKGLIEAEPSPRQRKVADLLT